MGGPIHDDNINFVVTKVGYCHGLDATVNPPLFQAMTHKRRDRCLKCGRKMGLASTYTCRCVHFRLHSVDCIDDLYSNQLGSLIPRHLGTRLAIRLVLWMYLYTDVGACSAPYTGTLRPTPARLITRPRDGR